MANFQKKARQSTTDHRRGQPPPVNDSTTAYFVNGVCHHPRGVHPDIDFNDWGPAQRPDWDPAWVFTFGKHKGKRLPEVQEAYPAYVQWLIRQRIYLRGNWFTNNSQSFRKTVNMLPSLPILPLGREGQRNHLDWQRSMAHSPGDVDTKQSGLRIDQGGPRVPFLRPRFLRSARFQAP